jgi:plastocyanin
MKIIKYVILCFLVLFLISGCAKEEIKEEEKVVESIGKEEVQKGEIPEFVSHIVVKLTEEKVMEPSELTITKGDVIKWVNEDKSFNHNLIIYSAEIERPTTKDIIVKSNNIAPGGSWDYTFEESGIYIVKDIYSGTMRGEITAEVIADFISEENVIGTVSVS